MIKIEAVAVCFSCQGLFNDIGRAPISTPCPNCGMGLDFVVAPMIVEALAGFIETDDECED
ncbi:hypothetical protein [Desulfovibrio sp. JC010]|uniref:hypothetical protein n=1 Tax=Desulfovibrio sp. JC010 TaxID=2593641 RepID=UPI0013D7522C|nr:hypothetical protein [Desulfovibrio sp. JC010]NDV27749.1 hypothetical protein [Desulfovibrio sp. JC010]